MEMSEEQIKEIQVRNRIVEGARQSFFEYGFSRVTMDEIAVNLGMSKKTLYKHFSSKDELLKSVMSSHCSGMDGRVQPIMENHTTDFIEKMMIMGPIVAEHIAKIPVLFLKDLEKNSPETWREFQEWRRTRIIVNFGNFLKEGMEKGVFRTDLNTEGVVTMYLTLIEGMFRSEVLSKLPLTPSQVYVMIAKVLTEGMIDESARKQFLEKTRPAMSEFSLSI
ncbi:MAG: TetR/AcrR family transcriptional regulator [Ignavibacteriae bacterium]|nr:TetR/AcrR family transcriptional regulator [Ignavibacteriota bacterium]